LFVHLGEEVGGAKSVTSFVSRVRVSFWRDPPFQGKLTLPCATKLVRLMVRLRKGLLTVEARGEEDAVSLQEWLANHRDQVFWLRESKHGALVFHTLGSRAEACREPLNITSRSPTPLRLISNFAHTPFILDGSSYASIEGFWQGLKFPEDTDRRRLAALYGSEAKDAGFYAPASEELNYRGRKVRIGTWEHRQLMERACDAKFQQNEKAAAALRMTSKRPLVHRTKPDSKTIPGVIMAEIWMRIRDQLCSN
jgi:predicted NAD-dependent protein-ADP-ribosyltransferase YbiA (DUF1768 family)